MGVQPLVVAGCVWGVFSLIVLGTVGYYSTLLLDAFYPLFVSMVPGMLLGTIALLLIIDIAVIVMTQFRMFFKPGPIPAVVVTGVTFVLYTSTLAFVVSYGSTVLNNNFIERVYTRTIDTCQYDDIICDQFKQTIGDIEMSKEELRDKVRIYVNDRSLNIGTSILMSVTAWLISHCVMMYYVFEGNKQRQRRKTDLSGAIKVMDDVKDDSVLDGDLPDLDRERTMT